MKKVTQEKGAAEFIFIVLMALIMLIGISNIVSFKDNINDSHQELKRQAVLEQRLSTMAIAMKDAYNIANSKPGCGAGLYKRQIQGKDFCLPSGDKMCTNITENLNGYERIVKICISMNDSDLDWRSFVSNAEEIDDEEQVVIQPGDVSVIIDVPNVGDSLLKTCSAPSVCLRLVMCRESGACNFNQAEAYQIVRLGD